VGAVIAPASSWCVQPQLARVGDSRARHAESCLVSAATRPAARQALPQRPYTGQLRVVHRAARRGCACSSPRGRRPPRIWPPALHGPPPQRRIAPHPVRCRPGTHTSAQQAEGPSELEQRQAGTPDQALESMTLRKVPLAASGGQGGLSRRAAPGVLPQQGARPVAQAAAGRSVQVRPGQAHTSLDQPALQRRCRPRQACHRSLVSQTLVSVRWAAGSPCPARPATAAGLAAGGHTARQHTAQCLLPKLMLA